MVRALVTGASGFVGGHLCRYLKERGYWVRAADWVDPRYGEIECDEFEKGDLRLMDCECYESPSAQSMHDIDHVYCLAADMGGMGFISDNHLSILYNNAMINLNMALAILRESIDREIRVLYTSSACVYPEDLQMDNDVKVVDELTLVIPSRSYVLKESDAWRGKPDTAYGVEKLFSEDIYHYLADTSRQIRIARFHNIFGPRGSWNDGREKAPAALCRKIAYAKLTGNPEVEIWGDGEQARSFCYIDDCLEMLYLLMVSDYDQPLNIGTDRLVTINELADIIADIAGIEIVKKHDLSKPQGVRRRNADLTKMHEALGYEPKWSLEDGLQVTYEWIENQVRTHMI